MEQTDEGLRFIIGYGGFIGVTMFPPFLQKGVASATDDYVAGIEYVVNLIGDDRVGIGSDFTKGYGQPFFDWITHEKRSPGPLAISPREPSKEIFLDPIGGLARLGRYFDHAYLPVMRRITGVLTLLSSAVADQYVHVAIHLDGPPTPEPISRIAGAVLRGCMTPLSAVLA